MISADLGGKVILVTAGASGIGLATAELFARSGASVAINDLPGKSLDNQVSRLRDYGLSVIPAPADIGDFAAARVMVQEVARTLGRLDYLFNNAGVGLTAKPIPPSDLDALTQEFWRGMLDVNLIGAFCCVQAAAPFLRENKGAIVNNASTAGLGINQGSSAAYAASKAALVNLTRSLAKGLGPEVRVNAVAPGGVWTDMVLKSSGEAFIRAEEKKVPLQRWAQPVEYAYAVAFLASAESDFITGQVLSPNGGASIVGI